MPITDPKFNPSGNPSIEIVKTDGLDLEETFLKHCPEGRHRSIALTHLETALMFAVKSIAEAENNG